MIGSGAIWANRTFDWETAAVVGLVVASALTIALMPLTWAALVVAGGTVVLMTLIHPQLGVLLIVPAVPFGTLRQIRLGAMNVGLTEVLVALMLMAWLARMVARREIRVSWPPLVLPLALFLGVLVLSSLGSTSLQHSAKEIVKWLEVLALYVFVANEVHGRWVRILILAFLGTGALAALHGIYQFLFRVGPEGFVLFGRFMRAYGTFEQPNPYAGYLGLTLPLAVGLLVAAGVRVGERVRGWWLVWAGIAAGLMFCALVMSWSRGAWLGFAATVMVMALAVIVRNGRVAVLAVVLVAFLIYALLAGGLMFVPSSILQRVGDLVPYVGVIDVRGVEITDANFALLERMAHWQSALAMWTDHPWLGVGIGNYEPVYSRYALPLWPLPLGHAHNYYLNIGAEAGVLGLAAYLLLWGVAVVASWRATQHASGWYWGIALGILGVLVHLSVHNVVDNLYVHAMYLHVAILLGIRTVEDLGPRSRVRISPIGEQLGGHR